MIDRRCWRSTTKWPLPQLDLRTTKFEGN